MNAKWETIDEQPRFADEETTAGANRQAGIASRLALVAVLGLTLMGAAFWAMNVSNANTRQVSQGLSSLQGRFDTQAAMQARQHK